MKIPVKIKLHNPLSLNNFTITDKRLYSVKQVTQNTTERGFSEVRIILYTQLNFTYHCLILNMQYLNVFEGECVQRVCEACTVFILNCKRLQSLRNNGKILLYACIPCITQKWINSQLDSSPCQQTQIFVLELLVSCF